MRAMAMEEFDGPDRMRLVDLPTLEVGVEEARTRGKVVLGIEWGETV